MKLAYGLSTMPAAGARLGEVVVLDDETFLCEMLAQSLREIGYRVIETHTVAMAQAVLTPRVRLLIADYHLNFPGGEGHALARRALSAAPALQVLLISGDHRALDAAVTDRLHVLYKPFSLSTIVQHVRHIIGPPLGEPN